MTVNTNGAVISGLDVTGQITVNADNVTIQNTKVTCGCEASRGFAITAGQHSGLTLKNVEIDGGNVFAAKTYQSVLMTGCDECAQYADKISDSYFLVNGVANGAHYEASYNNNATEDIEHSTLLNPHEQTATVFMDTFSPGQVPCQDNLTINNSLLAGGGYLFYACYNSTSAGSSHATITNNRFARCTSQPVVDSASGYICQGFGSPSGDGDVVGNPDGNGYYPYGGFFGGAMSIYCNQTTWSNNLWDDNGAATSC